MICTLFINNLTIFIIGSNLTDLNAILPKKMSLMTTWSKIRVETNGFIENRVQSIE